ncbi:D-threo-aldose 1-dehydrogenase [Oceanobacillus iheyensis HTE831]|uniref:D-threo-aldose 1-dehydrogenase n=1 Tax=Oceanobacillus iheyensis (strain DSM 14371 / CIP 107618 / JCM 11309 / KCTC 3954 / HTE831) TaxID=221109 RepID=Q8ETF4_OCEIH|nr:aldo/keto reductase [Oceanobacillus iheyensis]BAC12263.1 D-threo-aldose 1-dehydrogenase [Oceanobacillus iheyensis HTE831]
MKLQEALNKKTGLGTAPLGNMFRNVSEEEAQETIQNAWDQGIRYFDTAPFYGAGLAEQRLGKALKDKNRNEYLLSSKVGRIILDEKENSSGEGLFKDAPQHKIVTDYSEEATLQSIEDSLKRLNTDYLDMVFVHDISPDFLGDEWITKFDEARNGAFKVLDRLRDEGVIKSWGLGVNTTIPIELAMELEEANPDLSLTATQYTLMQHERALERMMPLAEKTGKKFVVGAPYNSGALLGGDHFDYQPASKEVKKQAQQLKQIADKHGITLKAAALQFSTANPAVSAVIPGSTRPSRIKEDLSAMQESIPAAFWQELISEGLISDKAPLPK